MSDLYDGEPWANLAKQAGFVPEDTETQARRAFLFCTELLEGAVVENERLRREREDLRMFCKGMARNIEGMLA